MIYLVFFRNIAGQDLAEYISKQAMDVSHCITI